MNGVDLAYPQQNTDFPTLKQHVDFVLIKATEGLSIVDSQFSHNRQGSRDVDLARGYYHFARFDSPGYNFSPQAEAQFFLDMVFTGNALQPGEILALDYEVNSTNPDAQVTAFCNYIHDKTGLWPWVYSTEGRFNGVLSGGFGPCAVWIAQPNYTYDEHVPIPFQYVCHQYGEGTVAGVNGIVDLDHFYGDRAAFEAFGLPKPSPAPQPTPPPEPTPTPITPPTTPKTNVTQTNTTQDGGTSSHLMQKVASPNTPPHISLSYRGSWWARLGRLLLRVITFGIVK